MRHPNASDLSEEQGAEYAYELVRRLGIPFSFTEKTYYGVIKDSRVKLPQDIVFVRGMRYHMTTDEIESINSDDNFYDNLTIYLTNYVNWIPVNYTGDIYQSSFHCEDYIDNQPKSDITYTINNNYAFLSESKGAIELSYRGLILDDEGYPMIPDNQSFEDALYYYILKEHFFPLVGMGKISERFYDKIEQNYDWYVGQAENSLMLSGMDHWESTMNGIRRLIQPQNMSETGFSELHKREKIKRF
jgi:hypothetical protein